MANHQAMPICYNSSPLCAPMIHVLPRRPINVAAVEHRRRWTLQRTPQVQCTAASHAAPLRRSANYQPNIWTDERVQSLTSNSTVEQEEKIKRINILKEQTRNLIHEKQQVAEQLQLIDHLQQLGVAYHFKGDIADVLSRLHASLDHVSSQLKDDLHATALLFRLLRANGFSVSQDLFKTFRDEKGNFEARCENKIRGLLSLYEASYLEKEGEIVLKEAMDFATEQLKGFMEEGSVPEAGGLRERVAHALELPLNWRLERVQHRWFIEACHGDDTINPLLLEFAKLDFNMVQDIYKSELRELSRWWSELGLSEKLPFFRDRLTENYLWAVGFTYEPDSWRCRMIETKAICFITLTDDIYDVYGTLDELQLFTDVVDRWDLTAVDKLPEYMKLCFFALFNMVHEEGYRVMKEKGLNIVPNLKRTWGNQCKAYFEEAKWFHHGQTPKLKEYLENAWVSVSGPNILSSAYCVGKDLTREALKSFPSYHEITRSSSMLLRLYDDMGTSTDEIERGDVAKYMQCSMHEKGVSEEVARGEMRELVKEHWRVVNGALSWDSPFEEYFKNVAVNLARTSQFFYQSGDGYAKADGETRSQIIAVLLEPIQI
ncbi:monoterpene synthase 7, chloroplastic-like [Curcuma longa]|uniref:monoterpene synthase 7, chloroplastic-like n=1 Tax=Curcuma longa TaxID=136217 RepID=UPI003D9F5E4B